MRDCSPLDSLTEILTDVPNLVIVYSLDGRYLFINRAAAEFLDADPLDVIGCHWRTLGYSPEIMEPLMKQVLEVGRTGRANTLRMRSSKERGNRVLDMSMTPLSCEDEGQIMAVLAIAHDITEFF